jgi:2-dehydro-3-deoxygluconokinase
VTSTPDGAPELFDLITVGETMAAFLADGGPNPSVSTAVGAESNVAAGMAQLGGRSRWISRLGDDALGRLVHDVVAGHGVDVRVTWDGVHPTGLLVKETRPTGTRVRYYRNESAARHLCTSDVHDAGSARWMHVTGITPALSRSAASLVEAIVDRRTGHTGRVSFDANYRPALWPDAATAAKVIIGLARRADLVFIGNDEADALLGTADAQEVASKLLTRSDQEVVLKRGDGPATAMTWSEQTSEPSVRTTVVDVTGAGDAFAAGYLTGQCWGWETRHRLQLGHFLAARAVGDVSDQGPALPPEELLQLRMSPARLAALCIPGSYS